jgi:acyl-CoA dehydrogenase
VTTSFAPPTDPFGTEAGLPEEIRELRREVRSYLERKVAPLVDEAERTHRFPVEILPALYDFGYVRGAVPESEGGYGMDYLGLAVLMEEAGRCWGSLRVHMNIQTMVAVLLANNGTPEQKARYLAPVLAGERRGFFALTESESGSDAGAMHSTAVRGTDEQGEHFRLNGTKLYITNASTGDFGLVFARVPETDSGGGVSAFIVDSRESDYTVSEIPHLAMRAATSCEVVFDDTRVPAGNLVGTIGRGLGTAMAGVNVGRLNMSMGAVGIMQACYDAAAEHAMTRQQFGRTIAGFQLVQQMVVRIAALAHTGRLVGYQAARTMDAGGDARLACSMAKMYCAESVNEAATLALQVYGGSGLMEGTVVERLFRDAREATIPEGTTQIQLLHIGRALLGVSAFR